MKIKNLLLIILLNISCYGLFAQGTISGNVYNDPSAAATITNSATPYSLPDDKLRFYLFRLPADTLAASVAPNASGAFFFSTMPAGNYYLIMNTENIAVPMGSPPPASLLETSWTRTGESLAAGVSDGIINGRTLPFTIVASNISGIVFGIQERPFAHNKLNTLFNRTAVTPTALSVNTGAAFTHGGDTLLSGRDSAGGTIVSYTIKTLPNYGTLYLNGNPVTTLATVNALTAAQVATLAYLPNSSALTQEQDIFTYYVTDNANTKSGNASYVIPFALLDGDNDTYVNRIDQDDDNDAITDLDECPLNSFGNLVTAYNSNQFKFVRPTMFGYATKAHRKGIDTTVDVSDSFGFTPNSGAIIISVSNANTHPTANEFYVNDSTGPTQWSISGAIGSYLALEHGQHFFSYDKRTITLLNGTPSFYLMGQRRVNLAQTKWTWGNDGYNWWLKNDTAATSPISLGILSIALTNPEPKYFSFASTANNRDEWATYFVRLIPECDFDMDGVPNRIDLDSDNDGCLDALEGSDSLQYADLTNATGTVIVGFGSVAQNQNTCNSAACVDGNGIPNTGTVTAGGQNIDNTYNPAIISYSCFAALPLKNFNFNAIKTQGNVHLNWQTLGNNNIKTFEVEKSINNTNWTKIGTVNYSNIANYTYTDNNPYNGTNFYRIKQLNTNGSFDYSVVKQVSFNHENNVTIYPNPVNNYLNIANATETEKIQLFDMYGRVCIDYKAESTNTIVTLSTEGIKAGSYVLQITNTDGTISTFKVLKR